MSLAILALLPSAVVLVAVLRFGASGLAAAGAALAAAAMVWLAGSTATPGAVQLQQAASDAAVLTTLVAAMIVPGILFVEATRRLASPDAIKAVVDGLLLPKPLAAILVAVGIGVTVESLTGMGVSLLVTVPLLLRLVERRTAIALALVGMSLMPFGALAISAHVGAKLAGLPIETLSRAIVLVAAASLLALPFVCLALVGSRDSRTLVGALAAGGALMAGVVAATLSIGIEVAGVVGGLATIVVLALISERAPGLARRLAAEGLRPYWALIALVGVQKAAAGWLLAAGLSPIVATERVSFAVATSPGVALVVATLLVAPGALSASLLGAVLSRAWRPVLAVAVFMLAARLLVECGAIAALGGLVAGLGHAGAMVAVAALGAAGGFVTGSGVSGNALFMPSAAAVGASLGDLATFAALQNQAAGYFAMASLPVAAILMAALGRREAGDEAIAMRTGLAIAGWNTLLACLAAIALTRW